MPIKLTQEIAENKLKIRLDEENCSLNEVFVYSDALMILDLTCNVCKNKIKPNYNNFVNKRRGCIFCNRKLDPKIIKQKISKRLSEENCVILTSLDTIATSDKLQLLCNICNTKFEPIYSSFVNKNTGCPKCSIIKNAENNTKTTEFVWNRISKLFEEKNCSWDENFKFEYTNIKTTMLHLICNKCNKPFNILYKTFVWSIGNCKNCKQSYLEKFIEKNLIENNINFEKQYKTDFLGKMSLDFYLTDFNVAIECQGLQHFSDNTYYYQGNKYLTFYERDKIKHEICKNNGIKILYFTISKYFEVNHEYENPNNIYYENLVINDFKQILDKLYGNT